MLSIDGETSTYTALNFGKDDGPSSTYSVLNFRKEEDLVHEYDDPPIASGPAEPSVTPQAGAPEQESKKNIGSRSCRKVCLLCLVMSILIAIVAGLSIYVSQIRQSQTTLDRNCHELNSTLQSTMSEISDLRHQFTQMETKYKLVNDSMAQICELLTSRREQTCFQDWIRKADRCYFISTLKTSYIEAKEHCSNFDARLLEINSKAEENIVFNALSHHYGAYRCGKCEDGEETSSLIYKYSTGRSVCVNCDSDGWRNYCNHQHRFICKKCTHSCTDIPERIQGLCQQSVGHT
ncbi:uncharacterized protein [Mobula birostris]|uniref:uncharacterized protein isoform X5 n=1 Tax=Mobula birostris TaxID=1983395 RepID=UPI003B27FB99